ncbi:MAG: DUF2634 domain-containing protein [Eubacterium sp.]|nr:DUF2634 domain-containing protein [Eubacterium sp.]
MSLFPAYVEDGELLEAETEDEKIPKEFEIDFATGQLTGRIVEGLDAIKVWIWLALQTPRYRYPIYTWDYGNEFEELVGQGYSGEYVEAEAQAMTEDCLLVNESIEGIADFSAVMENSRLEVCFTVETMYGDLVFSDLAVDIK